MRAQKEFPQRNEKQTRSLWIILFVLAGLSLISVVDGNYLKTFANQITLIALAVSLILIAWVRLINSMKSQLTR